MSNLRFAFDQLGWMQKTQKHSKIVCGVVTILMLVFVAPGNGHATQNAPQLLEKQIDRFVFNDKLSNVLETTAKQANLPVSIFGDIDKKVENQALKGSVQDVLELLATEYQLDWFFYNRVIHVSNRVDSATRVIKIKNAAAGKIRNILKTAGLPVERFEPRTLDGGESVVLSGPPRFVAVAEVLLEQANLTQPPVEPEVVTVSKLVPTPPKAQKPGNVMVIYRGANIQVINGVPEPSPPPEKQN